MHLRDALLAAAIALSSFSAHAQPSALMDAVEVNRAVNAIDDLHIALTNLMLSDETDLTSRKALIGPTLLQAFDLGAMTKAIVGSRTWRSASAEEQALAKEAFTDWMITQYASRFTQSRDPKFSTRQTRDGGINTIVVETVLRTSKRLVKLDYRMRGSETGSKIIDVFLDGRVSEVALRKSEYRKTIKDGGIAAFTQAVRDKTRSVAASPS